MAGGGRNFSSLFVLSACSPESVLAPTAAVRVVWATKPGANIPTVNTSREAALRARCEAVKCLCIWIARHIVRENTSVRFSRRPDDLHPHYG